MPLCVIGFPQQTSREDTVWKKPAGRITVQFSMPPVNAPDFAGLRDHSVAVALPRVLAEANITAKVAGAAKREPKRTAAAATERFARNRGSEGWAGMVALTFDFTR